MASPQDALALVQSYIAAVEARDKNGIAATLADDIRQVFPFGPGVEGLGAIFAGKAEVLAYVDSLLSKFSRLTWPLKQWTVSDDGRRVFLEAQGDARVAHSAEPYRNIYAVRFDVRHGLIDRIVEYANPNIYDVAAIPPKPIELTAAERGQGAVWEGVIPTDSAGSA